VEVDANAVIARLSKQIGELTVALAVRDVQIEVLSQQLADAQAQNHKK